jgi:hypothetical protein
MQCCAVSLHTTDVKCEGKRNAPQGVEGDADYRLRHRHTDAKESPPCTTAPRHSRILNVEEYPGMLFIR